ncbi:hypothetical protein [Methylophilus aquaticus]|uniref:Uncharacterized protein n=1 Tax=Methylophilus aquaticus TaxID=1971610 RepID=A0ABT9JSF1_9PROT|nr:hypothetical protein [Methylophilus aquaticus]MDP8567482.1 hypothetical protein [Methylophilus aquaticus]
MQSGGLKPRSQRFQDAFSKRQRLSQDVDPAYMLKKNSGFRTRAISHTQKMQNLLVLFPTIKSNEKVKGCNLLYIENIDYKKPLELLQALATHSVLAVGHTIYSISVYSHIKISVQGKRNPFVTHLHSAPLINGPISHSEF